MFALTKPLGVYMLRVYDGSYRFLGFLERVIHRAGGVNPEEDQHWTRYGLAVLTFGAVSMSHDYRLVESMTGREGLAQAAGRNPDVILLDLGLPDMDGVDLTRQLREWSHTPVIVISARGREQDKIAALDAGADDYLTKPFAVGELLARLRVALRHARAGGPGGGEPLFAVGELVVDRAKRQVTVGGQEVHLTPTEYKLLVTLVQHAGKVVLQRQLLREVWGINAIQHTHYLRVYMAQLRHKIEPDAARPRWLLTEPGVGYRLKDE